MEWRCSWGDVVFGMLLTIITAVFIAGIAYSFFRGPSAEKQRTVTSTVCLYTATAEGHEYVVAVGVESCALVHSASCPCHGKGANDGK